MPSSIPFEEQFFVEKNRNNKYEWLVFCLAVFLLLIHGIFFHWIPKYLRGKRTNLSLKHTSYFKFIRIWDLWTSCCSFKFRQNTYYYQPSIALLGAAYFAISGVFCFVETKDLNYQVHNYIIAKRILRVAVGNLPTIMVMITKNDLVSGITGLLHDRLTFIHKWVARTMWILITIHMVMTIQYWLSIQFKVMISIPPQIFGMIAYGFFCILTWGSLKFIRSWAFDFFLVKHRISNFIMLLMMFFHNPANKAVVLISVHGLVLDRVVSRVFTYIHKFKSPTKGLSEFEILDSDTISVTIPIRDISFEYPQKWYNRLLPKCRVWKAGQHIYLNVGKVKFFQYHPFTICSLSESGDMKLLIRKKKGFTKLLMEKLVELNEADKVHDDSTVEESSIYSGNSGIPTIRMKATFHGPYGAHYQDLIRFDFSLFVCAGSGGAFTFPVALNLLKRLKQRDEECDFLHRPQVSKIRIVWVIQKEENMVWFRQIIDEIMEFVNNGKATFEIYITQETIEQVRIEYPESIVKGEEIKGSTFQPSKSCSSECSLLQRNNGRPMVGELLKNFVEEMASLENCKSLAVVGCGPEDLINTIKRECKQIKLELKLHDVYCYTESF